MSDTVFSSPETGIAEAPGDVPPADALAALSRRAVVAGLGGIACAGALTACGGGSTATAPATAAPSAPAAGSGGSPSTAATSGALTSTSSVPVGGGMVFADKDVVVTQPEAGTFKAFSATCTHKGCKVKDVSAGTINCPCHGSKFAIADGSVKAGPAQSPLTAKNVTVSGDSVSLA